VLVSFSTDLADGATGDLLLTFDGVAPTTGGSLQATNKQIKWPANVKWAQGSQPVPRGSQATSHTSGSSVTTAPTSYVGDLVVSGAA